MAQNLKDSSFKIITSFTNLYSSYNALLLNHFHHFRSLVFIKSKFFLILDFKSISIVPIAPTITGINENLYSVYVTCSMCMSSP